MIKMIQKIVKKEVEPKLYAVALECKEATGLLQIVAYSLEDAMREAQEDGVKRFGGTSDNFRITGWNIMDMETLKTKIFQLEMPKDTPEDKPKKTKKKAESTNDYLKRIVENNDVKLFERIKGRLSENEIKYVKFKLSI